MQRPNYEDATLMVQLAQWWSASGGAAAEGWMWSDEFTPDYAEFKMKFPAGSEGFAKASTILNWYETVGTLYKHGLLNEELLFDWLAVDFDWDRIKGIALGWREQTGVAEMYENFEAMAKAQKG
jgi:hypothetical protein